MIRINLLPIKQIKKRALLRQQVLGVVALFITVLVGLGLVFQWQAATIADLKSTNAKLDQKKTSFNKLTQEIAELQKTRALLDAKVEAIKRLKAKSSLAVHIIDEVALRTPQDRMWLTSLTQNQAGLALQGIALDNATIAQYMQSMDASPYFQNAELINSSLVDVSGQKLKSFSMTISVVIPEKKPEPAPADAG